MDPQDIQLIERLLLQNAELRKLWQAHQGFEDELSRLGGQRLLTPDEEIRRKETQKRKLAGRDRIQAILLQYR